MFTLPDFKEKQLLFIKATELAKNKIQIKNENICFLKDDKIINQLSCHKVLSLFIIGDLSITTKLIEKCRKCGVSLFLLKNNLAPLAEIISLAEGNYLLRTKQYNQIDELSIAKQIVKNKIYNQLYLLKEAKKIDDKDKKYQELSVKVKQCSSEKELLGIEGSLTKEYFSKYFLEIGWYKRLPRVKIDIINVLMDLGYTILFNFVDALLGLYGFDCYKGIYHKLFFQRKSLVCDLEEPFRCLIDRQILKSYNLKQISPKDFKVFKDRYELSYDKQQKYLTIFAELIMDHKEEIFNYVRDFYYFILNNKGEMPFYKFNKKNNMYIVSYDFESDKGRTKFSKFLEKYGRRIQYSVFEIKNSPRFLENILTEINLKYKPNFTNADSIVIIQICNSCKGKVKRFGFSVNEEKEVLFFN